jgi:hypothetical protein
MVLFYPIMNESSFINITNNMDFQMVIKVSSQSIPMQKADVKEVKGVSLWTRE